MGLHKAIIEYLTNRETEFDQIPIERKSVLLELSEYISNKVQENKPVYLTVICTHNSRRSQMGQLWLKAAAEYVELPLISTFSGGTEGTAFYKSAVKAMENAGFEIKKTSKDSNPIFHFSLGEGIDEEILFSKKFDHPNNPDNSFAAILVCSDAEEKCPVVLGADARFFIQYDDPKAFDGTSNEEKAYEERCQQIAREMLFVMKKAAKVGSN